MVTTICFLEDPLQALKEIRRILCPDGKIIIGMLDKDSPLGNEYDAKKKSSKFYQYAEFYSVNQVLEWLRISGYDHVQVLQTIFHNPEEITALEPVKEGHGEGLFVVISAQKIFYRAAFQKRFFLSLIQYITLSMTATTVMATVI